MKDRDRSLQAEGGQGLVELALCLPITLLLIIGLIDTASGLQNYQALSNAVREVAREASVRGYGSDSPWGPAANDQAIANAVRARAVGLVASRVIVTSSWPTGNNARGSEVVVSASYLFVPVASAFLGDFQLSFSTQTRARIQH